MPRFLVTEQVYVDAPNAATAIDRASSYLASVKERTAERVAPELEVGMPVRLVDRTTVPRPRVPKGSEGVVVKKVESGSVHVVFHARHQECSDGPPWTLQITHPDNLERAEGWPL